MFDRFWQHWSNWVDHNPRLTRADYEAQHPEAREDQAVNQPFTAGSHGDDEPIITFAEHRRIVSKMFDEPLKNAVAEARAKGWAEGAAAVHADIERLRSHASLRGREVEAVRLYVTSPGMTVEGVLAIFARMPSPLPTIAERMGKDAYALGGGVPFARSSDNPWRK